MPAAGDVRELTLLDRRGGESETAHERIERDVVQALAFFPGAPAQQSVDGGRNISQRVLQAFSIDRVCILKERLSFENGGRSGSTYLRSGPHDANHEPCTGLTTEPSVGTLYPMGANNKRSRKRPADSPKSHPGRPRVKPLTALGQWLVQQSISREQFAERLTKARGGRAIARQTVDRLAHAARAPSLQLARLIEAETGGAVPASSWDDVPRHSGD